MNINQKFMIWCVKKTLHLWKPSNGVLVWLDDPDNEDKAVIARREAANIIHKRYLIPLLSKPREHLPLEAECAENAANTAWVATMTAKDIAHEVAAKRVEKLTAWLLNISVDDLKYEFVSNFTEEELKTIDPNWIEYVTAEIFRR